MLELCQLCSRPAGSGPRPSTDSTLGSCPRRRREVPLLLWTHTGCFWCRELTLSLAWRLQIQRSKSK